MTGRHFISGNADDLSQKIAWALDLSESERKKMSQNAKNFIKENFTKEIMCAKTLDVYRNLVDNEQ